MMTEIAAVQAAGHFVELGEAGADALDALAGVEEGVDAAFVVFAGSGRACRRPDLTARIAELEQGLFGAGEDVAGLLLAHQAAVHHVLRGEDDAAQDGLVLDDADVAVEIGDLRQAVVERDQVAEAVAGFQLVELHQLVGDGDAVDFFAAILELKPRAVPTGSIPQSRPGPLPRSRARRAQTPSPRRARAIVHRSDPRGPARARFLAPRRDRARQTPALSSPAPAALFAGLVLH